MSKYFVIGDVHGKFGMLQELLKYWDGTSPLVFLGDLIDRGEDSRSVLTLVCDLVKNHNTICLAGNHEHMFKAWLDNPSECYDHYRRNGGDTTINSLLGRPLNTNVKAIADAQRVRETCPNLVEFIYSLPYVYETNKYIFVHAGLDLKLADWHDTSDYDKVWIRQPFHSGQNKTGKTIVFGHTPTFYLFGERPGTEKLWQTADGKIGMDGGAVYGGVLHGLLLDDEGIRERHFIRYI